MALGLHVLAGAALMSYAPARSALFAAAPLMVELITPREPQLEPQPVEIVPARPKGLPKPKPVVRPRPEPTQPPPVLSAPAAAPAWVAAPPPPPEPAPQPALPPEPAAPVAAPPAAPPPVAAVTAPVFHADYLHNPPPAYPAASRRAGEQGRVILRVLVNPAGGADAVEVRTSSGHRRLDEEARETVRRWRFVPAKRGEQPVAAWVLIPISFRLEG